MVVSLAVPAVVGTPMIGTPGRVVGDRPSRLSTSSKSGLVAMTEIALHVSWGEPPPRPMSTSAPEVRKAARPAWTFSIGGLGATSEKTSQEIPAPSSRSVMRAAVPLSARTGSVTTKARLRPRAVISEGMAAMAPRPKCPVWLKIMRWVIVDTPEKRGGQDCSVLPLATTLS